MCRPSSIAILAHIAPPEELYSMNGGPDVRNSTTNGQPCNIQMVCFGNHFSSIAVNDCGVIGLEM